MRIRNFHMDRFGIFQQQGVTDLPPGISIFCGRNEAGKSTCLNFFRAMLFGYQRSGRNCFDYNAEGKGGGGWLDLETAAYGPLRLMRAPGARGGAVSLLDKSGNPHPSASLDHMLSGCTAEMYDAIFAFSLGELVALDAKDKKNERIRHALHGAAFGPGLEAPGKILATLKSMMDQIYARKKVTSSVHGILTELEEVRRERQALGSEIERYAQAGLELEHTQAALAQENTRRSCLEKRRRELERRLGLWGQWEALTLSQYRLAALPAPTGVFTPDSLERLERLSARVQEREQAVFSAQKRSALLQEDLSRLSPDQRWVAAHGKIENLREDKNRLRLISDEFPRIRQELERHSSAVAELCVSLGPSWNDDALADFPLTLAVREECEKLGRELAASMRLEEKSREELARLERERFALEQAIQGMPDACNPDGERVILPAVESVERLQRLFSQAEDAVTELPGVTRARHDARNALSEALALLPLTAPAAPPVCESSLDAVRFLDALCGDALQHGPPPPEHELNARQSMLAALRLAWSRAVSCREALRHAQRQSQEYAAGEKSPNAFQNFLAKGNAALYAGGACLAVGAALSFIAWKIPASLLYLPAVCLGASGIFLLAGAFASGKGKSAAETFRNSLAATFASASTAVAEADAALADAAARAGLSIAALSEATLLAEERSLNSLRETRRLLETATSARQAARALAVQEERQEQTAQRIRACFALACTLPGLESMRQIENPAEAETFSHWSDRVRSQISQWRQRREHSLVAAKALEGRKNDLASLETRLSLCEQDAQRAVKQREEAEAAWRCWLRQRRFDDALSAGTASAALESIKQGQAHLAACQTLVLRRNQYLDEVQKLTEEIHRLAASLEVESILPPRQYPLHSDACAKTCGIVTAAIDSLHERSAKESKTALLYEQKSADYAQAENALQEASTRHAAEREALDRLLEMGKSADPETFRLSYAAWAARQAEQAEYARLRAALQTETSDIQGGLDALAAEFTETTRHDMEHELAGLTEELAAAATEERMHAERVGTLKASMLSLEKQSVMTELRAREESLLAALHTESTRWARLALARQLLLNAKSRFEKERLPDVVRHAEKLFAAITGGAYTGISLSLDDESLRAVARDGQIRLPDSELSRGTREQLYLALRLAYIYDHARQAEPLPVIMDDILVNFDETRAALCAAALARFARENQILFFTCHEATADMLWENAAPLCPVRRFSVESGAIIACN